MHNRRLIYDTFRQFNFAPAYIFRPVSPNDDFIFLHPLDEAGDLLPRYKMGGVPMIIGVLAILYPEWG